MDLSGAGLDEELVTLLTLLPDEDHDHVLGPTLRRTAAERSWADLLS